MASKLRAHLTYANIVSTVCLFVVLGGSAYAAVTLTDNSVQSKHIKNGQVKRPDLANNAVTSGKVADASLVAQDFKTGQLPAGPKGDTGPQGPPGPEGLQGEPGIDGLDGSALAFASVLADAPGPDTGPIFDPDYTWGFEAVTSPAPGRYCLELSDYRIPFLPSPPIGVADPSGHLRVSAVLVDRSVLGPNMCPWGTFAVSTVSAKLQDGNVLWEDVSNVNFTVVLP